MQKLLLVFALFWCVNGSAQLSEANYTPLKCEGQIPESILSSAEEKYRSQAGTISSTEDKRTQKNKDAFYESSNYMLDRVLLSGDVLFGDTITRYVNKIAQDLLQNDPQLQEELQVYTFKSPYVNAFSTDQGLVFVNIGLIAQVANEAELAYVMAHEIVHFKEKHNTMEYIENDLIRRGEGAYREQSHHDKVNSYYQYSKDLEFEADKEGLKMLHKSSYNALAAKGVFDVLLYSYLPFDEEEFDFNYLKNDAFDFPAKMMMDSTQAIKARDEVDDLRSTHPNVKKRRKATYKYFKKMKGKTDHKKKYLTSKEEFRYIRDIARFEVIRQNIIEHRYDRAIYNTYLMEKKYPHNAYLKKSLLMALEGALRYKQNSQSSVMMSPYKKVEGSSQAVTYWLRKIKSKDLAVLIAAKSYEAYKEFPEDPYFQQSMHRSLVQVIHRYDMYEEDFYVNDSLLNDEFEDLDDNQAMALPDEKTELKKETKKEDEEDSIFGDDDDKEFSYVEDEEEEPKKKKEDEVSDEDLDDFFDDGDDRFKSKPKTSTASPDTVKEESKYDKIKAKKTEKERKSKKKPAYRKYMFYNYLAEDPFIEAFEKASEDGPENLTADERRVREREQYKEAKLISKKGNALGINKLVIIEPQYYAMEDGGNNPQVNHVKSTEKKEKFEEDIEEVSKMVGLDATILNPKNLSDHDIETFNAIMKLKEWLNEVENHEIDSPLTLVSTELEGLSEALGTKYIALPQIYNIEVKRSPAPYVWSMLFVVTIPWAISKMASKEEATYYNFKVVDIDALKQLLEQEYFYYGKDNSATLKGCLYNSLIQVRRAKQ